MSNLKKYMKVKRIMLLTMIMQAVMIFPAYADVLADLKKTKLYTGTIDILNGISMAVLAVSVLITVFLTIVNLVKYQTADQQERPQIKKNIKERANVHNTSAPNDNNSDEPTRKDSSDKMALHITLKDCNVYINTPPEKE